MSVVDTTLTNTILIPASDSLVSSNPLPEVTISKEMESYKTNFNKNELPAGFFLRRQFNYCIVH